MQRSILFLLFFVTSFSFAQTVEKIIGIESKEMFFIHRINKEIWNSSGIYFDELMLFHHLGFSTGLRLSLDEMNLGGFCPNPVWNGISFTCPDSTKSSSFGIARYLDIPLQLNYTFNSDSKLKVSVHAGLLFEKNISSKSVLNFDSGKTTVYRNNNLSDWIRYSGYSMYDELGVEVSHRVFKKYVASVGAYTYPRELIQTLNNSFVRSLSSPPILFNVKFGKWYCKLK